MQPSPGVSYPNLRLDSSRGSNSKAATMSNILPPWLRDIGDVIKSKKKELMQHAATVAYPPNGTTEPNPEVVTRSVELLRGIFPQWDESTLRLILEAHECDLDETISTVLRMEAETESENKKRMSSGKSLLRPMFKPKNPLPDDFLRVPGYQQASAAEDADDFDVDVYEVDATSMSMEKHLESSTIAHDDGTLYGREFEETPRAEEVPLAIPVVAEDAVSGEVHRRRMLNRPNSRTDSIFAKLTVIKRSKLDIVSAEDRIRTREPHRLLDCLTKASVLYRNGLINSSELENLRSMILTRMQPTKLVRHPFSPFGIDDCFKVMDAAASVNSQTITDHQWNCLVLKCKDIRLALSIRIIKTTILGQHTVVNMKSERAIWRLALSCLRVGGSKNFTNSTARQLSALTTRINAFPFPSRQKVSKKDDWRLAAQRQPVLEAYLRLVASLVTPSPLTASRGAALALLQSFLALPNSATLFHNTTQPAVRVLRVYAFHILQDLTTPEGKVCRKFLVQPPAAGVAMLDPLGDVLDTVQAYMMDHRLDEMKQHVWSFVEGDDDDDRVYRWVSDAVRHEVEEYMCVALLPKLWAALEQSMAVKEAAMKQRMVGMVGQPQSAFDIAAETQSPTQWGDAVRALREIDAMNLPVDKLRKLLDAANAIHALYQLEHGDDKVLSGDDFLPIFIYVIVHAQLQNPLVLLRVLNVLSDPEKRMGESGYYLASYEAALEHLVTDKE
ncbi:Aste57867_21896 [Aphanomyces stellatus]|uniref:Aste57867_21896 protein n=1 Tax=Aphanomyces stellatus TaxID=120398 RepID=A0A485LNM0_9STRA|nr:hypothetical protein As57867_021827 [Aphanomyces stellatus]VFT98564.1 Aste57867_21896 [Aphanomyces stellatus]